METTQNIVNKAADDEATEMNVSSEAGQNESSVDNNGATSETKMADTTENKEVGDARPEDEYVKDIISRLHLLETQLKAMEEMPSAIRDIKETVSQYTELAIDNKKLYEEQQECKTRNQRLLLQMFGLFDRVHGLEDRCRDFAETVPDIDTWKKICRGIARLHEVTLRNLSSFGIVPICPRKNDELDDELHKVMLQTKPSSADDLSGHIADVWAIGEIRDGVVWKPAEVTVFEEREETSSSGETVEDTTKATEEEQKVEENK